MRWHEMKEMNITVGQTLKEMTDPCRKWSSAAAHKPRRETSGFMSLLVEVHATRSPLGVQRVGLCTSTDGGHSSIPNIHQVDILYVNLHSTPAAGWGCF